MPTGEIFNSMIRTGIFRDDLYIKIATVIPLYKSGDASLFTNYIIGPSAFSKVFERLVYNRFYSFREKYNILFASQYALHVCKYVSM